MSPSKSAAFFFFILFSRVQGFIVFSTVRPERPTSSVFDLENAIPSSLKNVFTGTRTYRAEDDIQQELVVDVEGSDLNFLDEYVKGPAMFRTHSLISGGFGVCLLLFPGLVSSSTAEVLVNRSWAPFILAVAAICSQAGSLETGVQRLLARVFAAMCALEVVIFAGEMAFHSDPVAPLIHTVNFPSLLGLLSFGAMALGYFYSGLLDEDEDTKQDNSENPQYDIVDGDAMQTSTAKKQDDNDRVFF